MDFRARIVERFVEDLHGPLAEDEVIADRPTRRYSTGILYPQGSRVQPEEDEDGGFEANVAEEGGSAQSDDPVSLYATLKPSAAGLSFAVLPDVDEPKNTSVVVEVRCATYHRFAVDDEEKEIEGPPPTRRQERWRRSRHTISRDLPIREGERRIDLGEDGLADVELYVLVTPYADVMTATIALCNKRLRGDSAVFDEEQHLFQTGLRITPGAAGRFEPRPSTRADLDEDGRTAALIYRHVREYAVGHTCSARSTVEDGVAVAVETDWLPRLLVPSVSDLGDEVFDAVRDSQGRRPLDAKWLSNASPAELEGGLGELVAAYRQWIDSERRRVPDLPADLQAQGAVHVAQCEEGATRMDEGITLVRDDDSARAAFQLAQEAMRTQFAWTKGGADLTWRPFQLAFQLLVLASLADRAHDDRETLDLLWFPTGGGKTEAYLALTAFVIFLRRIRSSEDDEGSGITTLMRYTLRLLTVQQFQRAAAMISACELLRRRSQEGGGSPSLGETPIGIGLWVGRGATPNTLDDALNLTPGDPSTHEQITECPCCGSDLHWTLTRSDCYVECPAEADECQLAASGSRLPFWTIDDLVYEHQPSLLIGTVDKFAQIVRKLETGVLFGRGTPHAPPDLIIQDELHLISGPLGSMAGLYEVAIDELCRSERGRVKIIGSTATIRRASEQARALFDRATYQFPSPGLDAGNSGFAVVDTEHPGRLYMGITTAGRSATYMLQAVAASLLAAAADPGEWDDARDYYWTLVGYFNSLRELGRALVLMQDDVPISISQFAGRREEISRDIEAPAELTSRVASYEIRDMLARLEKSYGDPEAVDILVASNMISVGMDVSRLGLMVVNAQPKTLSEYIQATSRVGRARVPGLVVTTYNSLRARDRSHYETFETWHRSLYRDVEATSVTPFASRAQDKALHATLVALARCSC